MYPATISKLNLSEANSSFPKIFSRPFPRPAIVRPVLMESTAGDQEARRSWQAASATLLSL